MLVVTEKLHQLSFGQLMEVYIEGNMEKARCDYRHLPEYAALQQAEQDFYQYLKECFFPTVGAYYAVLVEQGYYVSAVRWEPYLDGVLISALETRPELRGRGYAASLLSQVLERFDGPVYSHVSKRNLPSLKVHEKCGFSRILEHARYLDGSVNDRAYTLRFLPEGK